MHFITFFAASLAIDLSEAIRHGKQGKEAIQEILDKLSEEDPDHMEVNFEKFPRRSIRRLGRVLPDSQNVRN